jgi:hypothetical protein
MDGLILVALLALAFAAGYATRAAVSARRRRRAE